MKTYEMLESALQLIEDAENWCQHIACNGRSRCAIGAVNFVMAGADYSDGRHVPEADKVVYGQAVGALNALAERVGYSSEPTSWGMNKPAIANFNNARTHAEVVALFQEAIRKEKAKEGIPVESFTDEKSEIAAEVPA